MSLTAYFRLVLRIKKQFILTIGRGSEEICVVSVCISSVCMTQCIINAEDNDGGPRNYDKALDDANLTSTVILLKTVSGLAHTCNF